MACKSPMWSSWGGRRKDGMSRMLLSNAMANLQLKTIQNTNSPPSRPTQPSDSHPLKHLGQELTSALQPASSDPGHCEHPVHAQDIPPRVSKALCVLKCHFHVHVTAMLLWVPPHTQLPLSLCVQAKRVNELHLQKRDTWEHQARDFEDHNGEMN